jgi:uncharacterized protein
MLFLLSPAKTLDYDSPVPSALRQAATRPLYADRAAELIALLRAKSAASIARLMDLSNDLATLNAARYAAWSSRHTDRNSRPAAWAFDGDVYDGLSAKTLSPDDWHWAQRHVVILSGLYGALRPLDKLQPYRLEMGTALANPQGRNLYAYWGDTLAEHLNARARTDASPVIVNLASQEYFRAADRQALKPRVIECVFEDWKGEGYKVISFFAKRARGAMARFAIQRRITTPAGLEAFSAEGYAFDANASTAQRLVFRRRAA